MCTPVECECVGVSGYCSFHPHPQAHHSKLHVVFQSLGHLIADQRLSPSLVLNEGDPVQITKGGLKVCLCLSHTQRCVLLGPPVRPFPSNDRPTPGRVAGFLTAETSGLWLPPCPLPGAYRYCQDAGSPTSFSPVQYPVTLQWHVRLLAW